MSDQTPFSAVSTELLQTIDAALPKLRSISDPDAARPRAPGKWSPKQVIGHLIDSASNNHQRFVRAQQGNALTFPPYAQEHWVACQHYTDRSWDEIVTLWHAYNCHLAHVIRHIPEERRQVPCVIESPSPVTLGFLADDYGKHLRHHLTQVGVVA
jgi:DinB family protein